MFRVGDIVGRIGDNFGNVRNGDQREVQHYSGVHLHFEDDAHVYAANAFKLIKPVWKIGDTARFSNTVIQKDFHVTKVMEDRLYEAALSWFDPNFCERVALAPAEPPTKVTIKADEFQISGLELKTTLAREMKVPTYLYDVVDFEPRLKLDFADQIPMDATWSVNVWRDAHRVRIENVDVIGFNAERLRKLAKLCTDLADLMG